MKRKETIEISTAALSIDGSSQFVCNGAERVKSGMGGYREYYIRLHVHTKNGTDSITVPCFNDWAYKKYKILLMLLRECDTVPVTIPGDITVKISDNRSMFFVAQGYDIPLFFTLCENLNKLEVIENNMIKTDMLKQA